MSIRVLMSAPSFLPPLTDDQCWSTGSGPLDPAWALDQWEELRDLVEHHIAPVIELQAEPWAPAMTFTRDLALVDHGCVVPLMPDSNRGPFEAPLAHSFLGEIGFATVPGHEPLRFDGGNVLADNHDRLLVGVTSQDSTAEAVAAVRFMEQSTGRPAYRVPVAGGRFPHIDMALSDLNGRAWLAYPDALPGFDLTDPAWQEIFVGRPVIQVDPIDGEQLACNLVVHDGVAIGPEICASLRGQIEDSGTRYIGTPLTELLKAGGGAHCLTLELPRQHRTSAGCFQ